MIPTTTPRQNLKDGDKITVNIPENTNFNDLPGEGHTNAKSISHREVLTELLDKVKPVDFRKLAELDADKELQKKHFLILVVDQLLELAIKHNWGLCRIDDFVYVFNGAYWYQLDPNELQFFLGRFAEKLGIDKFNARYYQYKKAFYEQFLSDAFLPKPEADRAKNLINLKNGTLEITSKGAILREHRREDFLTYQLPFSFAPNADAPLWRQFLNRVLPDPERQQILAEYLGYVFIKQTFLNLEKALLLYGSGANGKSVVFNVIKALLGEGNVTNYSLQSLTDETGYTRAKIVGKLVNYASEINTDLESNRFKQLVSGEPIDARLPYRDPFIATDYTKLIFNCNRLPIAEQTDAFFRRFLIIAFEVTIPEAEQDKQLAGKIIDRELPGVLNWVLEGMNRLLAQRRFSDCEAAKQAVEQYRRESDSAQMFLEEKQLRPDPVQWLTLNDLYSDYRSFCTDCGYTRPLNKTNLRKRFEELKIATVRRGGGWLVFVKRQTIPD